MAVLYGYLYYFYVQICYFIKFIISLCQDFAIMGIIMSGTVNRVWLTIGAVVAITTVLQFAVGTIPSDIFRFPLNVVIMAKAYQSPVAAARRRPTP